MKNNIICLMCPNPLTGKQTKYCSRKCHNNSGNKKLQDYKAQRIRAESRKRKLMEMYGSKCAKCGYNKNYSVLSFHHLDPSTKLFGIDGRKCSNTTWKALVEEANKCQLLCMNCHGELHHPDCKM